MLPTILFLRADGLFLIGEPDTPAPWVGSNPGALAALHHLVDRQGHWFQLPDLEGAPPAVRGRLRAAALGMRYAAPLLTADLIRGLHGRQVDDGAARYLWRYDPRGALVRIVTR